MSLQIITQHTADGTNARALANDVDVQTLDLEGLERIDLNFPKFTDGRALCSAVEASAATSAPMAMC
jgi:uncharacterized protein (DUF934 family)